MTSQPESKQGTSGEAVQYAKDPRAHTIEYARLLDAQDPLRQFREEFIIPTRGDFKHSSPSNRVIEAGTQSNGDSTEDDKKPATYLCGNSLGLQPKCTSTYVTAQLNHWARRAVTGHFTPSTQLPNLPWLDLDDAVKSPMAALVGAQSSEVAVMQTLTANLHLLMAAFYRPTRKGEGRYKIIIETKAFPSDHYAVESQIKHHNLDPADAMVLVTPPEDTAPLISTEHILRTIDAHADTTALIMLSGVQFYTGQLFDMERITAYAQERGIVVGWDLAHAAGNVEMKLHDWNVDFAAWCTYKYLNCGPGAIGALFVHDRHSRATSSTSNSETNGSTNGQITSITTKPGALTGWWGSSKNSRFAMTNVFEPISGASQFQLSNPSALDLSAVLASLSVFSKTSIAELRKKSLRITGYLEYLLTHSPEDSNPEERPYRIITPSKEEERGAQLSIRLDEGLLDHVMEELMQRGVVVDERKPDVVRVAPAPVYNNAEDCWRFVAVFQHACSVAQDRKANGAK